MSHGFALRRFVGAGQRLDGEVKYDLVSIYC